MSLAWTDIAGVIGQMRLDYLVAGALVVFFLAAPLFNFLIKKVLDLQYINGCVQALLAVLVFKFAMAVDVTPLAKHVNDRIRDLALSDNQN